jgi:hypothetical protein
MQFSRNAMPCDVLIPRLAADARLFVRAKRLALLPPELNPLPHATGSASAGQNCACRTIDPRDGFRRRITVCR